MPTAVAIQWVEVTTPNVPSISGRVVKGLGLILLMNPVSRATFRLRTYSTVLRFAGPDEVRPKCGRAHLSNSESAPPVRRRQSGERTMGVFSSARCHPYGFAYCVKRALWPDRQPLKSH